MWSAYTSTSTGSSSSQYNCEAVCHCWLNGFRSFFFSSFFSLSHFPSVLFTASAEPFPFCRGVFTGFFCFFYRVFSLAPSPDEHVDFDVVVVVVAVVAVVIVDDDDVVTFGSAVPLVVAFGAAVARRFSFIFFCGRRSVDCDRLSMIRLQPTPSSSSSSTCHPPPTSHHPPPTTHHP